MKYIKYSAICVGMLIAVWIVIRYYPIQVEVTSNAWDDDICYGLQCYFDFGEGFLEEDSVNTEKRDISNQAFVLEIDSSTYEQASQIRINFKKYPKKLLEDTKRLRLDSIVFKKMGIPFLTVDEYNPECVYFVDAIWMEGELKVTGLYPSIVLLENITKEIQKEAQKLNIILMRFTALILVVCAFVWKRFIRKRLCVERIFRDLKEEIYTEGKIVQPFIFITSYFLNSLLMNKVIMGGNFAVLMAMFILAICVFWYRNNSQKKRLILITVNCVAAFLLAAIERQVDVYYYILFVVLIVFFYGKISADGNKGDSGSVYEKVSRLDVVFVVLMTISYFVLLCYRLEADPRMIMDEMYSLHVGEGVLRTGEWVKWDFVSNCDYGEYSRAWIFYGITALFFKVFGTNMITARAVSVVCGVLFVPIIYFVLRKFYSRQQTVLTTLAICMNPTLILNFRTARMYSMTLCVSVPLVYCCFNAIIQGNRFKHENKVTRWIKENFDYNLKYLIATFVLLIVTYIIHMNTIILVVGFAAFIIMQAVYTKEKKYIIASKIVFAGALIIAYLLWVGGRFNAFYDNVLSAASGFAEVITILRNPKESYFWSFLSVISGVSFGVGLTLIAYIKTVREKKEFKESVTGRWNIYMLIVEVAVLFVFIFMANHYAADRYAIFVLPIVILTITQGFMYLCGLGRTKMFRRTMIFFFLLFSVRGYAQQFVTLYQGHPQASNYKKEAEIVTGDRKEGTIALYPSSFASFYYQDIENLNCAKYGFDNEIEKPDANMEDFIDFALENREGYVTIENRNQNSRSISSMAWLAQWLTQIGGVGYDNSNINVYKYHFISEDVSETGEMLIEEQAVYNGIMFNFGLIEDKKYLEVIVTDEELLESKFVTIRVRHSNDIENYIEGYQLYMGEAYGSKRYLIELESKMDNVQEFDIVSRIGVCDAYLNLHDKSIVKANDFLLNALYGDIE